MISQLSPIVIFTYRRVPDKLINSLLKNNLSSQSEVIKYLQTIEGLKNIKSIESKKNKGLAASLIDGVTNNVLYKVIYE